MTTHLKELSNIFQLSSYYFVQMLCVEELKVCLENVLLIYMKQDR